MVVRDVLAGIPGLAFVELGSRDVVRHRIVQDIVDAYGASERPGGRRPASPLSDGPAAEASEP
jgi:phosphate starvation-inducible PhoH-like protein